MNIGDRIKNARKSKNLTQKQLADKLGASSQVISNFERGYTEIPASTIIDIARVLEVSVDYLLADNSHKEDKKYWELTEKDERSIQKDLQKMIDDLSNSDAFAYSKEDGEMDENTRQLLIMSLENSLRIAKEESKKRFTPKKYRN
ncbi:helix-turn-helix domain-containing protein [Listeria monocytogenes]|nr:helix-turn-helix domain-containing protein [Listeria monocytogenes]